MSSKYHSQLQKAIEAFGANHQKIKRVKKSGRFIHITHPTRKKAIIYNPDIRFELKNRKIIIFEIVDSQKEDKTMADIIRALLIPNATEIYFIVKSEEMGTKIVDMASVILFRLADVLEIPKKKMPLIVKSVFISENEIENKEEVQNILNEEINI